MNISLVPELEQFVKAQIESGAYQSENELFGEALRLLSERDEIRKQRIKAMDDFIDEALQDNEFIEPEQAWKEIDKIIEEARKKHA